MKILFGYDGSECAQSALSDMRRAGLPRECEVVVLSVGETLLPPPPPSSYEVVETGISRRAAVAAAQTEAQASKILSEAHGQASEAVGRLLKEFPTWGLKSEAAAGDAAWAIIQRADEWPADLVVVGSRGRGAIGRLLLGSVSAKVAAEAHCSVRVARCPAERSGAAARILVGVDGSQPSRQAVRAVARRLWSPGTAARVVAVRRPRASALLPLAAAAPDDAPSDEAVLARAVEQAADDLAAAAGLLVSTAVLEGDPGQALIAEAVEFDADCIYVGARGVNSRLERWLLGSVSDALVKNAQCSVEVVRDAVKTGEGEG